VQTETQTVTDALSESIEKGVKLLTEQVKKCSTEQNSKTQAEKLHKLLDETRRNLENLEINVPGNQTLEQIKNLCLETTEFTGLVGENLEDTAPHLYTVWNQRSQELYRQWEKHLEQRIETNRDKKHNSTQNLYETIYQTCLQICRNHAKPVDRQQHYKALADWFGEIAAETALTDLVICKTDNFTVQNPQVAYLDIHIQTLYEKNKTQLALLPHMANTLLGIEKKPVKPEILQENENTILTALQLYSENETQNFETCIDLARRIG